MHTYIHTELKEKEKKKIFEDADCKVAEEEAYVSIEYVGR